MSQILIIHFLHENDPVININIINKLHFMINSKYHKNMI